MGGRKGEEGEAEAREGGREKERRGVSDSAERRNGEIDAVTRRREEIWR